MRAIAFSVLAALLCACSDNDTQIAEPVDSSGASESPAPATQTRQPCPDVDAETGSQLQVAIAGFPESECFYADGRWVWTSQSVMLVYAEGTWRRDADGMLCVMPTYFSREEAAPPGEVCRVPPTQEESGTVFQNLDRSRELEVQVTGAFG